MDFLRHHYGRGKCWGHSLADKRSYIDKKSQLFDDADVWESQIFGSTIAHDSRIRKSVLYDSWVGTMNNKSEVSNAFLRNTKVYGGTVLGSHLEDCRLIGDPVIQGDCYLVDCMVTDAVVVENNIRLRGLRLFGKMRIGYGSWDVPPRYEEVMSLDGSISVGITESTDGHAYIGCQRRPIQQWLRKAELFGKIAGWDADVIEQGRNILRGWV